MRQDAGLDVEMEITAANSYIQEKIRNEIYIKFSEWNKEEFETNEQISVSISVKNIEEIRVKIYEINLENYYKERLKPFTPDINVEGLAPTYECVRIISEYKKGIICEYIVDLSMLDNKLGLFIVEIMGGGRISRGIIRIGSLSWIYKCSMGGIIAYIVDPNRYICKEENIYTKTGIWIDNQFLNADGTGRIIIPYSKNEIHNKSAILIHGNMAQLVHFILPPPIYIFSAIFILHSETLIEGNTATVFIEPTLTLCASHIPLSALSNLLVIVDTSSYIDDIPHSKTYHLNPMHNDTFQVQFTVPPQLNKLSLIVKAQIYNERAEKREDFCTSKSYKLDAHSTSPEIYALYLHKIGGEYILQVRGKGGEKYPNAIIHIYIRSKYLDYDLRELLETDLEGEINLGNLVDIKSIRAILQNNSNSTISRRWMLEEKIAYSAYTGNKYPNHLHILKDQILEFPISCNPDCALNPLITNLFSIILESKKNNKYPKYICIDSHPHLLQIFHNNNTKDCQELETLRVKDLEEGVYLLCFSSGKSNHQIFIHVYDAHYWGENDEYILHSSSLLEARNLNILTISDIALSHEKLTIQLNGTNLTSNANSNSNSKFRVHLLAYNYFPPNIMEHFENVQKKVRERAPTTQFPFHKWKNIYKSNREVNRENIYITERREGKSRSYLSIDKPKLLLKRVFTRETEDIYSGEEFEGGNDENVGEIDMPIPIYISTYREPPRKRRGARTRQTARRSIEIPSGIEMYQGFMGIEPIHIVYEGAVDSTGRVIIEGNNIFDYSTLLILVSDIYNNTATETILDISQHRTYNLHLQRDLCLRESLEGEKVYRSMREMRVIREGGLPLLQSLHPKYIIIDSIESVLRVLQILSKEYNPSILQYLHQFTHLVLNWEQYSLTQKHTQFSIYTSHELHLFLKFKDLHYFSTYVLPYLANKLEKSFIDLYLLGAQEALREYLQPYLYSQLSAMERALLAQFFGGVEGRDIVHNMVQMGEFSERYSEQERNKIFDAILSLQVMDNLGILILGY